MERSYTNAEASRSLYNRDVTDLFQRNAKSLGLLARTWDEECQEETGAVESLPVAWGEIAEPKGRILYQGPCDRGLAYLRGFRDGRRS